MGYCMSMVESTAFIADEDIPGAVKALKLLDETGHKSGGSWGGGVKEQVWFSWVDQNWADSDDIEKLFAEWRYELERIDEGGFTVTCFDGEKLGDDEQFWNALSPYMSGYVQMLGEEGAQWRWKLGGDRVEDQMATTTFG